LSSAGASSSADFCSFLAGVLDLDLENDLFLERLLLLLLERLLYFLRGRSRSLPRLLDLER